MAAWSCAADVAAVVVDAVATAAADWSVGAENREAVLAVVAVVAAATTRLGDAVAPATTGALGDSIEGESLLDWPERNEERMHIFMVTREKKGFLVMSQFNLTLLCSNLLRQQRYARQVGQ
jgi:hypothetical protein